MKNIKVLLVNGSPHKNGCTYTALTEAASALEKNDVKTEIFHLGAKAIAGCIGCYACMKTGKCFMNDIVNEFIDKAFETDGFIFGSPVYFASASGSLTSFMDRAFFSGLGRGVFGHKPAAAITCARRAGTTATFDQINKYFTICNMPVVSSQYWNMVHGTTPDEVRQDLEGMQTMRTLGNNMAWLLKSIEAGKASGIKIPENEPRTSTNFIR